MNQKQRGERRDETAAAVYIAPASAEARNSLFSTRQLMDCATLVFPLLRRPVLCVMNIGAAAAVAAAAATSAGNVTIRIPLVQQKQQQQQRNNC